MHKSELSLLWIELLSTMMAPVAIAQDYSLSWHSVDGGGTMFSTGGAYELGGAVGQFDAGVSSGAGFALRGGFWSIPRFAALAVGDDTCAGGSNDGSACATDADCPGGVCGLKSRYVTLKPANSGGGELTAIRMEIVTNAVDPTTVGDVWWAGASMSMNNAPNPALSGAQLLCEATPSNAQVWPAGNLHLFGEPIVPESSYEVRMCDAAGANCSDPLLIATGLWGDVASPFGGTSQPNFSDINAAVAKFQATVSAPDTPRTDLTGPGSPGTPNVPNQDTDFADINAGVNAFQGGAYPFSVPECP